MHPRQQPGPSCILVITIHKILSRLVVQRAFWKGHNHQTPNDREDVTQGSCGRPVLLQSIDADGTGGRFDIGMVYFGKEVSAWGRGGEVGGEDKFELEVTCVIWRLLGSLNFSQYFTQTARHARLPIQHQANALRRTFHQVANIASHPCQRPRRQVF